MRVYVDLSDGQTKERVLQAVGMCCGLAVADEKDADLFVGDRVHPLLDSVLVSDDIPQDLSQVIDVLLPGQSLDYYLMKFRLLHCYALTHCNVETFLDEEIYRSQRYNIPLSVAMVRVYQENEYVIRALYNSSARLTRTSDKVLLYDKVTLIAVLPYTSAEGARVFVSRLHRHMNRVKIPKLTSSPEVISAVCQITPQIIDSSDLILRLEDGLNQAVTKGQRIVVI
ncbi:hypothetical protein ACSFC1_02775 [Pseudothermotoga sp. U03pept]|uniref:hypothetical protein n=1 Tax=Pseudothermotoga sp. U03pept TaxID=3447012 RepID=UPI003F0EB748